ncbi:MAG: starch-binding protein [Muribaculaceae bacterium]|nr:starch-binding protein [Muribaculaceae bacterium]
MAEGEQAVFFEADNGWKNVKVYVWNNGKEYAGAWSGTAMTYLGNKIYKWTYTGTGKIPETAGVIFSADGQTADLKWVNGGFYNFNGYVKTIEGAGEIADDPTPVVPVEEQEWTAYFDNSSTNWNKVYAWVWDVNHGNKNYTGGTWPGMELQKDATTGHYKFSCKVSDADPKMKIIFNNGSAQTADFDFVNNGIYTATGFSGQTGVESVMINDNLKIRIQSGVLTIESPAQGFVTVARMDGVSFPIMLNPGLNSIELPKGLYIINGKKVRL